MSNVLKKIAAYFVIWRLLIYLLAVLAIRLIPFQTTFTPIKDYGAKLPYLIWIFGNFDGMHYISIAQKGYQSLQNAFFPLYPIFVRIVQTATGYSTIVSAQIVSWLSLFIALFLIVKLMALDKLTKITELVIFIILLYPASVFYGASYNDSLFFLFATACLYLGRKKNWLPASVFGALATLTRLNGLALSFYLLTEYFIGDKTPNKLSKKYTLISLKEKLSLSAIIRSNIYFIVLLPLAFFGYLVYTHFAFGDWNLVFSNMKIWHQDKITLPVQVVWRYIKILVLHPSFSLSYWVAALESFFVALYVYFLIWSFRRLRTSYWLFFFLSVLIPSLTGTFQGMPRYGLHLYPFFLSLGLFLSTKNMFVKSIYFVISVLLMLFIVTLYTRGYFVA